MLKFRHNGSVIGTYYESIIDNSYACQGFIQFSNGFWWLKKPILYSKLDVGAKVLLLSTFHMHYTHACTIINVLFMPIDSSMSACVKSICIDIEFYITLS